MDIDRVAARASSPAWVNRAPRLGNRVQLQLREAVTRPPNPFGLIATTIFGAAVTLAITTTVYLIVRFIEAKHSISPFSVDLGLDDGMVQNLSAGVWFFWLELFAIVLGIKIYDGEKARNVDYLENLKQLEFLEDTTVSVANDINAKALEFYNSLTASMSEFGKLEANLAVVDKHISFKIGEFATSLVIAGTLTPEAQPFAKRMMTVLNRMHQESYWAVDNAMRCQRLDNADELETQIDAIFAACDPWDGASEETIEFHERDCLAKIFDDVKKAFDTLPQPPLFDLFFPAPRRSRGR